MTTLPFPQLKIWLEDQASIHGFRIQREIAFFCDTFLTKGERTSGAQRVDIAICFSKIPIQGRGEPDRYTISIAIIWSGCQRSLAAAMAAVENYQAAIQFVARLLAYVNERKVEVNP